MRILRAPDGCPWDREQTLHTLRRFVLEEAYEVLDAIDRSDYDGLRDELGDFLLEAVFLAQICAEEGRFTIGDALKAIAEKLIRRHPHVFGEPGAAPPARLGSAREVKERWEQIKAQERSAAGGPGSLLSGIPATLPALLRAYEIGTRAATVGFDWSHAREVAGKVEEEWSELQRAIGEAAPASIEDELGDLLFSMAQLARKLGLEPEATLRGANEKFTRRFQALERALAERGLSVQEATLEEMEGAWRLVKDAD